MHVRFGSLADIATGPRDVRFTPESEHLSATRELFTVASDRQAAANKSPFANQKKPSL
jgi:hypothetical protein